MLTRATERELVVFSNDVDFLVEAAARQRRESFFSGVVFARQGELSVGAAVRDLEIVCRVLSSEEIANQIVYLPL